MTEPGNGPEAPRERHLAVYLVPNLFTTLALLGGFYSIINTIGGDFAVAGWAIVFAAVMDMLDGRVARMIDAQSDFGAQFDSLSDVVCFGLAPAVLAYEWGVAEMGRMGFAAGFFFCAATAVRLARFNVTSGADGGYFIGLPSPMAGVIAACAVLTLGSGASLGNAFLVLMLLLLLAVTMVSEVRYSSFKDLDLRARLNSPLLILTALLVITLAVLVILEFGPGGVLSAGLVYLAYGYFHTVRDLVRQNRAFRVAGRGNFLKFAGHKARVMLGQANRGNDD